jgi:multidrug transporter EmrE-like cation transporter
MRHVLLLTFALLLASGQILFKKAAMAVGSQALLQGIINGWTLAALVLYGGATLLWISILRSTPLSAAYPYAALGFVLVPLASQFIFGETLHARYLLGTACIIAGIILSAG